MRLFVSEFLCGGGWSGGERPASLVREGAAMLRAVLRDLLRIPQMRVVTTWDRRLTEELGIESPSLQVLSVSGPDEEREVFTRLCHETDASYVIAPELDDELSRRVGVAFRSAKERSAEDQQTTLRSLNCSVEAIDLCGDKWALYEHLTRCGIPTLPTQRVGNKSDEAALPWPRVLKLRMGAGSQAMQLVTTPDAWKQAVPPYDSTHRCTEAIAQPWVRGMALSVGAVIDRSGTVHLLPLADQYIDPDQGFAYLGGRIPSAQWGQSVELLIRQTLSIIPGLRGYVGIDLLIPDGRGIGFQPVSLRDELDMPEATRACIPNVAGEKEFTTEARRHGECQIGSDPHPDETCRPSAVLNSSSPCLRASVVNPLGFESPTMGTHTLSTPLIVEINPRLTTSYVGYQKLCLNNLAALWLGDESLPQTLSWRSGHVEFNAAGEFQ